jgi:hypothetical protein
LTSSKFDCILHATIPKHIFKCYKKRMHRQYRKGSVGQLFSQDIRVVVRRAEITKMFKTVAVRDIRKNILL